MVKQIPILFSTEMVKAILDGRKVQTRRIVKSSCEMERPAGFKDAVCKLVDGYAEWSWPEFPEFPSIKVKCPYGNVGDILWARETFANGNNGLLDANAGKDEKDWTLHYWLFKDGSQLYSDGSYFQDNKKGTEKSFDHVKWKPSIHMPKDAARIWLKRTSTRIERLTDISQEDALKEGIINRGPFGFTAYGIDQSKTAKDAFKFLWSTINGENTWSKDTWVWVLEFEKTQNPREQSGA